MRLPWLLGCQQVTLVGCWLVVVAVLKKWAYAMMRIEKTGSKRLGAQ
jgi:hypothetical protein